MRKSVSPMFAVIVILIAVAIGTLSFFWRLRAYDTERLREAKMLQAEADAQRMAAIRSGTYGRMQSRMAGRMAQREAALRKTKEEAPGGPMKGGAGSRGPGAGNGAGRASKVESRR